MQGEYRIGTRYREEAVLADGTRVFVRCIAPSDKDHLRRGLARLSPNSRYLRFFTAKPTLSEAELTYLTEVDGVDHFALVAGIEEDGVVEGLGVARFIRLADDPETAEAAVAVLDAMHGKGLGTLLLRRLAAAAHERGVRRFAAEFLEENAPVKGLLEQVSPHIEYRSEGDVIHAVLEVPPASWDEPADAPDKHAPAHRVLSEVARGAMRLRHRLRLLKDKPPQ